MPLPVIKPVNYMSSLHLSPWSEKHSETRARPAGLLTEQQLVSDPARKFGFSVWVTQFFETEK